MPIPANSGNRMVSDFSELGKSILVPGALVRKLPGCSVWHKRNGGYRGHVLRAHDSSVLVHSTARHGSEKPSWCPPKAASTQPTAVCHSFGGWKVSGGHSRHYKWVGVWEPAVPILVHHNVRILKAVAADNVLQLLPSERGFPHQNGGRLAHEPGTSHGLPPLPKKKHCTLPCHI
jgi:hypothetical protein